MQQPETRSWREVLRKIIQDPKERRRLAQILDMDTRTLDRWADGTSNPRSHNLLQLLEALPTYRYTLTTLITQEFPEFMQRIEASEVTVEETIASIGSDLYERVLAERTNAFSPLVRWNLCTLLLQHFVSQLDSNRTGVAAILAQCIPTPQGEEQKVRSLREQFIEYSTAWVGATRGKYFLGAESLAGAVVTSCQPQIYNDTKQEHFPLVHSTQEVNSIAAYPIQLGGQIAGCLLAFSTQQNFFSKLRLEVIRRYSNLLTLAFQEREFYKLEDIDLQIMPEGAVQLLFLSSFNERVNDLLSQAEHHGTAMKRLQAEQLVLHQFLESEHSLESRE